MCVDNAFDGAAAVVLVQGTKAVYDGVVTKWVRAEVWHFYGLVSYGTARCNHDGARGENHNMEVTMHTRSRTTRATRQPRVAHGVLQTLWLAGILTKWGLTVLPLMQAADAPTPVSRWNGTKAHYLELLPRPACLRLVLFCKRPPLCPGALWPMPAWIWRDIRSLFFFAPG